MMKKDSKWEKNARSVNAWARILIVLFAMAAFGEAALLAQDGWIVRNAQDLTRVTFTFLPGGTVTVRDKGVDTQGWYSRHRDGTGEHVFMIFPEKLNTFNSPTKSAFYGRVDGGAMYGVMCQNDETFAWYLPLTGSASASPPDAFKQFRPLSLAGEPFYGFESNPDGTDAYPVRVGFSYVSSGVGILSFEQIGGSQQKWEGRFAAIEYPSDLKSPYHSFFTVNYFAGPRIYGGFVESVDGVARSMKGYGTILHGTLRKLTLAHLNF